MNCAVMFSSKTDLWGTPQALFDELNKEFDFNLDPCANEENHKCEEYFDKSVDGLSQDWGGAKSVLQSSVWERNRQMGKKSV